MDVLERWPSLRSLDAGSPAFKLPFDPEELLMDSSNIDPDFDRFLLAQLAGSPQPDAADQSMGTDSPISASTPAGQQDAAAPAEPAPAYPAGLYALFDVGWADGGTVAAAGGNAVLQQQQQPLSAADAQMPLQPSGTLFSPPFELPLFPQQQPQQTQQQPQQQQLQSFPLSPLSPSASGSDAFSGSFSGDLASLGLGNAGSGQGWMQGQPLDGLEGLGTTNSKPGAAPPSFMQQQPWPGPGQAFAGDGPASFTYEPLQLQQLLGPAPAAGGADILAAEEQQAVSSPLGGKRNGRGNKAAARFREKQRDTISSLEAELSDKLAQLQVLSAENELLKLRSTVLEATVRGREYHIQVIKEHGPPVFIDTDEQQQQQKAAAAAAAAVAALRSGSSISSQNTQCSLGDTACTATTAATAVVGRSLSTDTSHSGSCGTAVAVAAGAGEAESPTSAAHAAAAGRALLAPGAAAAAAAAAEQQAEDDCGGAAGEAGGCSIEKCDAPQNCPPAVQKKAIRCIKRMSAEHILTLWRQFLNDVTGELLAAEDEEEQRQQQQQAAGDGGTGSGCSSSSQRIAALVDKYSYLVKWVALLNPGVLYHLLGRNVDTGAAEPYSDMHWRGVLAQLALTRSQTTQILACAELYFGSLSRLLAERATLQAALRAADEGLSECQRRLMGEDGVGSQLALLDQLSANLKREHVLRIMLNCFVWGRSLNSIQYAKAAVYSHPFFPDVHAMVCILFEDAARLSPGGQPTLVFPHRAAAAAAAVAASREQQQQQGRAAEAAHEQLLLQSAALKVAGGGL